MHIEAIADLATPFFLDTNILIYTFDRRAPEKQHLAQALVRYALQTQHGIISSQVVQEFLNGALNKFKPPMTIVEGQNYLQTVLMPLCQHLPTRQFYGFALLVKERTGYSFYDALVLAAAIDSGCKVLLSEDLQHGRVFEGVRIVNPF